ncbi:MAG: hypothetical protein KF709_08125 [Gemmatimonadaceae bacterium]|nr:hypothetical protein [Gemmatimonadaceae bacterium]
MTSIARSIQLAFRTMTTLLVFALPAAAQTEAPRHWEARITSGSMMPVGELQQSLRSAPLTAAQVSWSPRPQLAVTGTLGWARSRDLLTLGSPKVDAITLDLGVELRSRPRALGRRSSIDGFAGLGAGLRRYDSRAVGSDASRHAAAYAAVGSELVYRRVGLRLELREYVGGFRPLNGAGSQMLANDVVVMTALRIVRRAPQR